MDYKKLLRLTLPLAGGIIIGRLTVKAQEDYKTFKQPPFSPPSTAFPIVWPILYTTMGIAYELAYAQSEDKNQKQQLTTTHYTQLTLNYAWSILYFNMKLRGTALIESYCLLAAAIITAQKFYHTDKKAGLMLIPYVAWLSYASYLNGGSWILNKDDEDYE
ncbi:TspO/MBR family protein [Macrococcoides caseolyticum]|uniref:TspO/MBR family protein n=1 Tax=Macrococcoides caseolyticum TaxID=69966 RepID=UPI001F4693A8|nr:TspO/MBR family protein [Macrococcus caseolyticus]MCE4956642.1 tryptophan-rich sensory protein [Macrococcus caseolyticus]